MVAYGFKKRFVEPIVKGTKTQTIRSNGKRRHARVGESLQLYCGMRTKSCVKIIADPICSVTVATAIGVGEDRINYIRLGNRLVEDLDEFAQSDGFQSLSDMHAFWIKAHGKGCFEGTLIGWEGNAYGIDQPEAAS